MNIDTTLKILNRVNGAHEIIFDYAKKVIDKIENPTAVLMGIAYGGEVEGIAQMWKNCGKVYGFDTFEDKHPSHLSADPKCFAANCMNHWYDHKDYGTDELKLEYQQSVLDKQNLDNAILTKGEVSEDSCKDLKEIHFAFLDMDMVESMSTGYEAVKDKMPKGSYLFLHDTQNIPKVGEWYKDVVLKDNWEQIGKWDKEVLVGLKK